MIQNNQCNSEFKNLKGGRPLVLNKTKWNGILQHLHRGEAEKQIDENEQQYREYLKRESEAMTKKWENSVNAIRERKNQEKLKREQDRIADGEKRFKELKENDEKKRTELVKEAQSSIQKLKIGSRQLDSAFVLSEVLRGRELQCQENAKMRKLKEDDERELAQEQLDQANQWCADQHQKMIEGRKRNDGYKRQLFAQIQENGQNAKDRMKKQLEQECQEIAEADEELKSQVEKERMLLQKKREALRKNALEAMKISEQRRLRIKMENEIEDKIVVIMGKKSNIEEIKKENNKKELEKKEKLRQMIAEKVKADLDEKVQQEHKAYTNGLAENELKFTAAEQLKIENCRKIKAARIQQHIEDTNRRKELQRQELERKQWDLANRIKNHHVNVDYDRQRRAEQTRKIQQQRTALMKQMTGAEQKLPPIVCDEGAMDNAADDKHFFEYANELIDNAKSKNRPVFPIQKAIESYKINNRLNPPNEDLPHMKCTIDMMGQKDSIKYDICELKRMNSSHSFRRQYFQGRLTNKSN